MLSTFEAFPPQIRLHHSHPTIPGTDRGVCFQRAWCAAYLDFRMARRRQSTFSQILHICGHGITSTISRLIRWMILHILVGNRKSWCLQKFAGSHIVQTLRCGYHHSTTSQPRILHRRCLLASRTFRIPRSSYLLLPPLPNSGVTRSRCSCEYLAARQPNKSNGSFGIL